MTPDRVQPTFQCAAKCANSTAGSINRPWTYVTSAMALPPGQSSSKSGRKGYKARGPEQEPAVFTQRAGHGGVCKNRPEQPRFSASAPPSPWRPPTPLAGEHGGLTGVHAASGDDGGAVA